MADCNRINNDDYSLNIELKSESVQELMDRAPSLILRHGIGFILLLLCCVFMASKYIPYPDELQIGVILSPTVNAKKFINAENGELLYSIHKLKSKVSRGDTLCIIAYNNDTISFTSPFNGIAYMSDDLAKGDLINPGKLSILVTDDKIIHQRECAYSYVNEESIKNLKCGMRMVIDNNKSQYIINDISTIPDGNGLYTVKYIRCTKSIKPVLTEEEETGKVILDDTNVFDRFFAKRIKNMIKIQ